jgi:sugar/nucleoside kinase (ribokinase family)
MTDAVPAALGARSLVLCVGRTYCDLVFTGVEALPTLGEERFAQDLAITPGGGAYITAVHLAGLGRAAALVSRFGQDPLSRALEPALAKSGVDLAFLDRADDAGPQLTVVVVQGDDRAFLSRRAGGARPATLATALRNRQARHLHIAEFATLAEVPELVSDAKAAGLTVSLDPSWDDAWIRSPALLDACAGVDLFLPNAAEARAITRADALDEALERLAARFPAIVIKDGGAGARLAAGDFRLHMRSPAVEVRDPTGAGDAFNSGFIDRWLDGADLATCLAYGIACGSCSVEVVGGATATADRGKIRRMASALLQQGDGESSQVRAGTAL